MAHLPHVSTLPPRQPQCPTLSHLMYPPTMPNPVVNAGQLATTQGGTMKSCVHAGVLVDDDCSCSARA